MTGSGKSYLMREFCQKFPRIIFIDPKHEHNSGLPITAQTHYPKDIYPLLSQENFFILYQPIEWTEEEFNTLCKELFKHKDFTLFIDEIHLKVVDWHRNLIRMGRRRGIGIWHITQRPRFVDNFVFSEAEHFFVFRLQLKSDKEKVQGIAGDEILEEIDKLNDHEFLYYSSREGLKKCSPLI